MRVLAQVAASQRNGLTPNCFAEDGNHAWNSVDASLWYAFAVQSYLQACPDGLGWVREHAWPALKGIISGYRKGPGMDIYVDENGLLHAGNAHTQLTWMDAQAAGKPVTPRHGCPVEINALWYNTLAFADYLARLFGEAEWEGTKALRGLRLAFFEHFWVTRGGGYLGDVWRDGMLDQSVRPNQILAVSLPYPVLEEQYQPQVVECVRNKLLAPFGLRTLAPDDPHYKGRYEGGPDARDAAYHQGTVWPWPLGHYTDALLRVAWDTDGAAQALLDTVTPLFCEHLTRSGLGSISEIFDASPPYRANGCIAQAWSTTETLRMLIRLKEAAPAVYTAWEQKVAAYLANPWGDTAGICRAILSPAQEG
ncbi:MAG: amylo-alpha-1,6-glucosidase [Desulfovibrionaceae bacterium]|nr:amylo-alpha-1,6-glucosidase [Desulfovibrionaceae bacterium]